MSDKSFKAKDIKHSVVVGGNVDGSITNVDSSGKKTDASITISQLADELSKLRVAMDLEAQTVDEHVALGEVAKAEKAANAKDLSAVLKHLQEAGRWALEIAEKVGIPVAIEVLKRAIGM